MKSISLKCISSNAIRYIYLSITFVMNHIGTLTFINFIFGIISLRNSIFEFTFAVKNQFSDTDLNWFYVSICTLKVFHSILDITINKWSALININLKLLNNCGFYKFAFINIFMFNLYTSFHSSIFEINAVMVQYVILTMISFDSALPK